MIYFVYVLYNKIDDKFYYGFTENLKERLKKHKASKLWHRNKDFSLIFFEGYINKADTVERERYFKTTKGRRVVKLMLKNTLNKSA